MWYESVTSHEICKSCTEQYVHIYCILIFDIYLFPKPVEKIYITQQYTGTKSQFSQESW